MMRLSAPAVLLATFTATAAMSPSAETRESKIISITEFRFAPTEISVRVGDTVVWRNQDSFVHTTAADSGTWTSGELRRDHQFQLVPGQAGRFSYHCAAHPVMRGVLIVRQ